MSPTRLCLLAAAAAPLLLPACGSGAASEPEGTRRPLVEHWPARKGEEPVVRTRGREVVHGGRWVKDGEFVFFDERGREVARGGYRRDLENGPWVEIEEDGFVGRGSYRDGLRAGRWTYTYPDGSVHAEGAYVNGRREGQWIRRYPDGSLAAELMYRGGKLHGACTFYEKDGEVDRLRSGRYEDGEPLVGR